MKTVRDLLRGKGSGVWFTHPESTVFAALEVMAEKNVGALLVLDNDEMVGIFSERDYARKVILKDKSSKRTTVGEIMTREVVTVGPGEKVETCMGLMTEHRCRHLPVLHAGELMGVVSIGDVVKAIMWDQEETIHHLEEYIVGRR